MHRYDGSHDPRDAQLQHRYGISTEDYRRMFVEQGRSCLICKARPDGKRLSVDHDHDTGRVRGLLCRNCNTGLGMFQDDPALLKRAANYLNRSATVDCLKRPCTEGRPL